MRCFNKVIHTFIYNYARYWHRILIAIFFKEYLIKINLGVPQNALGAAQATFITFTLRLLSGY